MKVLTKDNFQREFSFPIGTWDGRRVWLRIIERRLQQVYEYCGQDGGKQFFEYHIDK